MKIEDKDISTVEALHDLLLDKHGYELSFVTLKRARELTKKMYAVIDMESSSRTIHSQPNEGFYYMVKFYDDTEYEVAKCIDDGSGDLIFNGMKYSAAYIENVCDWKKQPLILPRC